MNRAGLHRALLAAGVPGGHYRIEGVHEPSPPPVDFLFLRRAGTDGLAAEETTTREKGVWETGVYERGTYTVAGRFTAEDAACAHLLRLALAEG